MYRVEKQHLQWSRFVINQQKASCSWSLCSVTLSCADSTPVSRAAGPYSALNYVNANLEQLHCLSQHNLI